MLMVTVMVPVVGVTAVAVNAEGFNCTPLALTWSC
jgi:hypothetical protein